MSEAAPLFVVGCARSGTTLLRRILNTHPEIWLAKESQYLAFLDAAGPGAWQMPLSAEGLADHVNFVKPFLEGTGFSVLPTVYHLRDAANEHTIASVYRAVCALEQPERGTTRYWGDNTPRYISLVPKLDETFPDARYIHLVRDARDVVRSLLAVWFGGNTALTAAQEWVERVGAGLAAAHLVGDRLLLVRFEDLVQSPGPTLTRIASFLGVSDSFVPNDLGQDTATVASQPHLANVGRPIDPSAVGRYAEGLSSDQVAEVEQLCQPFLRALGYPVPTWRASWSPTTRFTRFARSHAQSVAVNVRRGLLRRLGR